VEHLDEGSDGSAVPVAVAGLHVEVGRGTTGVLAGLLGGEELGTGRALRVEEPFADHPGIDAASLELRPRDDAPEVWVRRREPRGAIGHIGSAAEEKGVVRRGTRYGGDGAWCGEAAARAEGEGEEGGAGGRRSGRNAGEKRRRRRHVLLVWRGRGDLAAAPGRANR
jgi:hypothetical protein